MPKLLEWLIIAAHLAVYAATAFNIWVFSHHSQFYRTILKVRSLPLIYFGFAAIAVGASYEIAEHITDHWIYVSRLSDLNRLFYTFISGGICLVALGLRQSRHKSQLVSRLIDIALLASLLLVPILYGIQGSKTLMQIAQLPPAIAFVLRWYWAMRDWRVFLYLVLNNIVALGFGIALIATGNQVFHIFVGGASAASLLLLGYLAWIRPTVFSSEAEEYNG